MAIDAPNPPYLGPAKFHGDDNNKPIGRIVVHCTVSPCKTGGARDTAHYFAQTVTRPSSAHYVVDPGEVVQCVYDGVVAYHAPPNTHSIGVELCDPQTGKGKRWQDASHDAMLDRAARLVAQLALAYDVPIHRLSVDDLLNGRKGICGHVDVSHAWHQTDHTDPGDAFPWVDFMARVRSAAADLVRGEDFAGGAHALKKTAPAPTGPTNVSHARDHVGTALRAIRAGLDELDKATEGGRHVRGARTFVVAGRAALRRAYRSLPER